MNIFLLTLSLLFLPLLADELNSSQSLDTDFNVNQILNQNKVSEFDTSSWLNQFALLVYRTNPHHFHIFNHHVDDMISSKSYFFEIDRGLYLKISYLEPANKNSFFKMELKWTRTTNRGKIRRALNALSKFLHAEMNKEIDLDRSSIETSRTKNLESLIKSDKIFDTVVISPNLFFNQQNYLNHLRLNPKFLSSTENIGLFSKNSVWLFHLFQTLYSGIRYETNLVSVTRIKTHYVKNLKCSTLL